MKKKLLLIVFFIFMSIFLSMSVKASTQPNWWFCKAVGNVDKEQTIFLSFIWNDQINNNYHKREVDFLKFIKKITNDKFRPSFQAKCRDFYNRSTADEHRNLEIKTAEHYNFNVSEINWRWIPNGKK